MQPSSAECHSPQTTGTPMSAGQLELGRLCGRQEPPPKIEAVIRRYLTAEESQEICRQFLQSCVPNHQVLWSGMQRGFAQKWADGHDGQTLTTSMGPLMDVTNPQCPRSRKSDDAWYKYIHGASAIFAWYITGSEVVTVLSQPPPQRFHPSGLTSYQTIEEPVVTGKWGNTGVQRVVVVHPTVADAGNFNYQMWPVDESSSWTATFGARALTVQWRKTKTREQAPVIDVQKVPTMCKNDGRTPMD